MQRIEFSDLVKIFGATQATTNVQRYIRKDFRDLKKEYRASVDEELRVSIAKNINRMENDPSTFVMAMQLDDSGWNITRPQRVITDRHGVQADCSPLKDKEGDYQIDCPKGSFSIHSGDYIFLSAENFRNLDELEVMSKDQFARVYFQSEDTTF